MKINKTKFLIYSAFLAINSVSALAGTIRGKIYSNDNKEPISGITVRVKNTGYYAVSKRDGEFEIPNIKNTDVIITVSSIGWKPYISESIKLGESENKSIEIELNPNTYQFNEVSVFGATKRQEKITSSPAAITMALPPDIEKSSRNGQIGSALIGTPGLDVLQNGASDFLVNTRGFNNGLNRRILVLQDGRDASMPLLGAMEWNSFSMPLDEFSKVELVRGPSASLYGANAFNGVLNLTSYAPKEVLGAKASILAGDYKTFRGDIRYAGMFDAFSYKITLGRSQSLNYSQTRSDSAHLEYPGLTIEKRPLSSDDRNTFSTYGTLRMDYDLSDESKMVGEFGYSRSGNELYVFGLGRTLVKDVEKPYYRLEYNSPSINVHTHYMQRSVKDTMWLMAPSPNTPLLDDSKDFMIDAQHNFFAMDKLHLIWGISQQYQQIRTSGTSIPNDVNANYTGVYSQADFELNKTFKFVGSVRADFSNMHDNQLSPRLAIVIAPIEDHQFRLSFGRSYQRPNYSELYRSTPFTPAFSVLPNGKSGPPVNFAKLEQQIADSIAKLSGGSAPNLNLNLNATRSYALGNSELKVEKNLGFETGYKGVFSSSLFITVDAYYNQLQDFITNFLPGVNSNIPAWSPTLADSLSQYQTLVKNMVYNSLSPFDRQRLSIYKGLPTFVISNANVGKVNQWGVDIGVNYYITNDILIAGNYSYYDFEVKESSLSQPLVSNTSPHRINLKATYTYQKLFDVSLHYSHTTGYDWVAGTYIGKVPSYNLLNFNAGADITSGLKLGVNVNNVLNYKHYEMFGGSYMPRYATMKLSYEI